MEFRETKVEKGYVNFSCNVLWNPKTKMDFQKSFSSP